MREVVGNRMEEGGERRAEGEREDPGEGTREEEDIKKKTEGKNDL